MRKNYTIAFLIVALFSLACSAQTRTEIRSKINFNNDWKFSLSDSAKYNKADFDDSNWRKLDLPHDWSAEAEFSEKNSGRNAFLPGGIAWYRKDFKMGKENESKHIEIQFDGIYRHAQIWLNGNYVGVQYDGFTSFYVDITPLILIGEKNTIAIRVDNSDVPNCRWYTGSGIYRNVWLTTANSLHVANWGTYITTPEVNSEEAKVDIRTTIENTSSDKDFVLETVISDGAGNVVGQAKTSGIAKHLRQFDVAQTVQISSPKLWSVDSPELYKAISRVKVDGKLVDEYSSTFGIRTLRFDAQKGFFLNGKNMKMKGVCLHHDAGPVGAAVPIEIWERRLENLKKIGCNAIRTSHNPTAPEFMDFCDRMGFLVMDEFVDKWEWADFSDPFFHTEWQKNYGETIRRDRNHPSVILWSVENENYNAGDERQNMGLKRYGSFVRSMDPTRPVISGMARGKDKPVEEKVNDIIESCAYMDLIALNYGEQWCKLIADKNPGKPYVSTESYTYFNSGLEKRFANIERAPWIDVLENDQNMGLFLWVGIDYLGESKDWPSIASVRGLLDMAGNRKDRSYLYEAFWSDKPMVHIEVYETNADDFSNQNVWGWPPMSESWNQPKGKKVDVVTYTNCESVDLYLNNKKIGTQKLADFPNWIMKWREIAYKPGTLRAVGKQDGKAVCEFELKTAGKPAGIILKADKSVLSPGRIAHVELNLVDAKGIRIPNDDRMLEFQLEGNGEILGLTNGDVNCIDSFSQKHARPTYRGKCLCILKAGKNPGNLKLTVSSNGIPLSSVNLTVGK